MTAQANEALASYISDMHALEEHIQKAVAGQLKDTDADEAVTTVLRQVNVTCETHMRGLLALHEALAGSGQGVTDVIKKAAAGLAGIGAAAIDLVRTEQLAKNLRDDYTALSLANAGYAMLYTSALSTGAVAVQSTATQFLADHTRSATDVFALLPFAVISTLREDGLQADSSVVDDAKAAIAQAMRA